MKSSGAFLNRWLIALALAGGLALPTVNAEEISGAVVRIGVVNDQSGPADVMGRGSVVSAQLTIADFQKDHPNIKVELVSADHQNKPDIGTAIVRKWFDVDGVDVIADVGNSAVGLALQPLIKEKNKIAIYTAVASTDLTGKQCTKTGFSWLFDATALVSGPVRTLVAEKQDTWFFVAVDYAFGKSMVAESKKALASAGGKSLGEVFFMANADYSSFLLQARSSKAKVVAFAGTGDQLVNLMKQWDEFDMSRGGQRPVALLMFLTDVHSMGIETAHGLTSTTPWYWALSDETRALGERFYKAYQRMPTAPQAAVYSMRAGRKYATTVS